MVEDEQELTGGNASESVVRIGHTVRKPWLENSPAVQSYLGVLRSSGVDVPQPLGRDEDGRQVVEYVEGVLALDQLPLGRDQLLRVGRMIRQPVEEAALRLRAVVDGYEADGALRQALPEAMAKRTAAMFNLLKSSNETGFQPWADMYANGHGEHWRAAAEYVLRNQVIWEQTLA